MTQAEVQKNLVGCFGWLDGPKLELDMIYYEMRAHQGQVQIETKQTYLVPIKTIMASITFICLKFFCYSLIFYINAAKFNELCAELDNCFYCFNVFICHVCTDTDTDTDTDTATSGNWSAPTPFFSFGCILSKKKKKKDMSPK